MTGGWIIFGLALAIGIVLVAGVVLWALDRYEIEQTLGEREDEER